MNLTQLQFYVLTMRATRFQLTNGAEHPERAQLISDIDAFIASMQDLITRNFTYNPNVNFALDCEAAKRER